MFSIGRLLGGRVRACGLVLCAAVGMTAPVGVPAVAADRPAEHVGTAERRAIEATIRRQLDAFGHDDADAAFAVATPDIQRMFGTADQFLQMVRDHYEPVYRPASVRFVRLEQVDGQWVQTVQITDGDGRVWRALFFMRRQADHAWKVGGCQLVETNALAT